MFASLGNLLSRVTRLGRLEAEKLVGPVKTSGYASLTSQYQQRPRDLPPLGFEMIRAMLLDPAVRLGLAMRAAPIAGLKIAYKDGDKWTEGVRAKRPEVGDFVRRQLARIWQHGLDQILQAQIWGWSAGEITYKLTDRGTVEVDELLGRHAIDTRVLLQEGQRVGVRVVRVSNGVGHVDLPWPKAWFHTHRPEPGAHYGSTILHGAYSPWADKCFQGGATDVRRLFMHKDAYGGVDIAYPDDTIIINGQPVPTRDIALQIAEQLQAGGVTVRPKVMRDGEEQWTIDRATVPNNPQHILQFPKDLDTEIYHGLEIPDDIIESDTGGWAGKRIPMAAFYASLDAWASAILRDLTKQCLEPLVLLNSGRADDFEVTFQPLAEQAMEQQSQASPGASPGGSPFGVRGPSGPQVDARQAVVSNDQSRMSLLEEAVGCGLLRMNSDDGSKWITIGGRKSGDAEHAGGFPVQLDQDGKVIAGGPKGLKGRHVSSVGDYFRKVRNTPHARKQRAEAKHDRQAKAWGVTPEEYRDIADQVWKDRQGEHAARETAKAEARRRLGITAADIRRWENDGFDHASGKVKGLDTLGRELASQYPELGWGGGYAADTDEAGDYDAKLWDLLREGKQSLPSRDSDEFHAMVDEYMNYAYSSSGSGSSLEDDGVDWSKVEFSLDWREGDHPRDSGGEFSTKSSSAGGGKQTASPEQTRKRWFSDGSLKESNPRNPVHLEGDRQTVFTKELVPSQESVDFGNRKILQTLEVSDSGDPDEQEFVKDTAEVRRLAEGILKDNPDVTPPEFWTRIKTAAKAAKLRNWNPEAPSEEVYSWKDYSRDDATAVGSGADLERALDDAFHNGHWLETKDGDDADFNELLDSLKLGNKPVTAKQLMDRAASVLQKNRWRIVDGNGQHSERQFWPQVFGQLGFDGLAHDGQQWSWEGSRDATV